jgi:hypothetical protein
MVQKVDQLAGEAICVQQDVIAEKAVDVDDGFVQAGEGSIDRILSCAKDRTASDLDAPIPRRPRR